jgi:hypothetical protein
MAAVDIAITAAVGLPTGVVAGLIARLGFNAIQARRVNRHLWDLLNFGQGDVYFVFPHREGFRGILPPVAAEDFLAINNVTRVLNSMGWRGHTHMRDTEQIRDNREANLVTVGSPRTNDFTRLVLEALSQKGLRPFTFEETPDKPGHWHISRERGQQLFPSFTFDQQKAAQEADHSVAGAELDDVAVLAKFDNPWNAANKVLVVAGVRGIGTWGASDYLRKRAPDLHKEKKVSERFKKNGNFVAYIAVRYRRYHLVQTELLALQDLT